MNLREDAPPVVGRFYLVPCVYWPWRGAAWQWWPVLGPLHEDREFFNFDRAHYHIDPRFLTQKQRSLATFGTYQTYEGGTQIAPICRSFQPGFNRIPDCDPGSPVLRRKQCTAARIRYWPAGHGIVRAIQTHYAGNHCGGAPGAWICPHRGAPLSSIAPDDDGLVTCPLHGLRIDPTTGTVTSPLPQEKPHGNRERPTYPRRSRS